jgi:ABC-type multidrug transport system fused ATPase/permease subunit
VKKFIIFKRLYQITIDGHPLASLNLSYLRNLIAVVSQEPILFNCSIEENIRFGRENVSNAEMVHACRMANADSFIAQLPNVSAPAQKYRILTLLSNSELGNSWRDLYFFRVMQQSSANAVHSCRAGRNSELQLPVHLSVIRLSYCSTRLHRR